MSSEMDRASGNRRGESREDSRSPSRIRIPILNQESRLPNLVARFSIRLSPLPLHECRQVLEHHDPRGRAAPYHDEGAAVAGNVRREGLRVEADVGHAKSSSKGERRIWSAVREMSGSELNRDSDS